MGIRLDEAGVLMAIWDDAWSFLTTPGYTYFIPTSTTPAPTPAPTAAPTPAPAPTPDYVDEFLKFVTTPGYKYIIPSADGGGSNGGDADGGGSGGGGCNILDWITNPGKCSGTYVQETTDKLLAVVAVLGVAYIAMTGLTRVISK